MDTEKNCCAIAVRTPESLDGEGDVATEEPQPQRNICQIGLTTELYSEQIKLWPREGKHILAHYDDSNIVVYQAFKPSIAAYAVKNQKFGGPDYSFSRMSWIKTNFLWMMYRCGWTKKYNQEKVLALTISRAGFEQILSLAYSAKLQKSKGIHADRVQVRLQWDPDHLPSGEKAGNRRAVQLGLKGEALSNLSNKWLVKVEDITSFVKQQHQVFCKEGQWKMLTPRERVYTLQNPDISERIELDFYSQPTLVGHS